jgi:ubiquinone/menaquinone biosynthesis C-methylase UbiE
VNHDLDHSGAACPSGALATTDRIARWLCCPLSRQPLVVDGGTIRCPVSGFLGVLRDDVAVMVPELPSSFFDDKYHIMKHGRENAGEWELCYAKQTALFSAQLRPGMRVLDVGCGPSLPYAKPDGVSIIGIDPSFNSIRENGLVDLRVAGSACAMPVPDASIDAVVCFYSIHHMTGGSAQENEEQVARALGEFGRVLKPGGALFVYEMSPSLPYAALQKIGWNLARRVLGRNLDVYFWPPSTLREIASRKLPRGARFQVVNFDAAPFTLISPIFTLPRIKMPRFLYPLHTRLYQWQMP